MFKHIAASLALLALCAPTLAQADDKYVVHPVRLDSESIRFDHGSPTIDADGERGAVQVTPLAMDHGSFSFSVAVLNKGDVDADFDVSDVTAEVLGKQVSAFTREELERKAQNRAMWASIAVAVAGGVSSIAAANQRDYYHSRLVTPHGTYRGFYSAPSAAGQVQAAIISAGTVYTVAKIQENLDATRDALGNAIVQRTTIGPSESYGGQVIFNKIKLKTVPQKLTVVVRWNGEDYRFGFVIGKKGMKAPAIAPMPVKAPVAPPASEEPAPAPQPQASAS